jgi:uracil-DNA glycosylase
MERRVVTRRTDGVSAAGFLPPRRTLPALRTAAAPCRGCPLWAHATQTVFGEGPAEAAVLVALGATAAGALLGPKFRVTKQRGQWIDSRWAPRVMATVHQFAILRAPVLAARRA